MATKSADRKGSQMIPWMYDMNIILWSTLLDIFFREVHPRGSWRIPREGAVIFVGAPHANQFVDPLLLMGVIRRETNRRIAFLVAAKSVRQKLVGAFIKSSGAVPVERAQDMTKAGTGKIYLPDYTNDPLLVRGVDTDFETEAQKGGILVLPTLNKITASAEIAEILGPRELRLKRPFDEAVVANQLTAPTGKLAAGSFEGSKFKLAPHVDQSQVYAAVHDLLGGGGALGIFPEGGSHDRTELLPLKAGVAIMALGALAAHPECDLKIVTCGMNYFHAHKFRSRAVIEFGVPFNVPSHLVELYKKGERKQAIGQLLDIIYQSLESVTVLAPDYETLMLVQAVRRLYITPTGKRLSLSTVVEFNRRLVKGYAQLKDTPRVMALRTSVLKYNKQIGQLGIRDHQVQNASLSTPYILFILFYRTLKLLFLGLLAAPGTLLFAPVFVAGKVISIRKSRSALAASTVKLQGRDIMATWKVLVATLLAPGLYALYAFLLNRWIHANRIQGLLPVSVPPWTMTLLSLTLSPLLTIAALRFGEIGMDILKSLRPMMLALSSADTFAKLRETRAELSVEVNDLINTMGPEIFPDFDFKGTEKDNPSEDLEETIEGAGFAGQ